ncbi:5' nucleotidase, NT5C type [Terriglobus aquaticus]|uniref:5' nucleotidase, NT5C type n=1 Tax=Terriglobus aquaticus TaxID=940139 RepID=A0ABW9KF43_9BACT|nr:5'-3'-deoxyribonucleotidase [Terriglobus aquaticus]
MAVVAIDMDEVMADTVAAHISRYNEHFGERLTKADLEGKWLWQVVPSDRHDQLSAFLDEPDFFGDLPLMPDAVRVIERLSKTHDVFIASAAMEVPHSFNAKYRWLKQHFPFLPQSNYVFCGTKSILAADFLIDDNPRQLRAFRGQGLLFSSPHNEQVDADANGWTRLADWRAVERLFFGS